MKQGKINKAYSSLLKLNDFKLPLKKAYAVYKLYTTINESFMFAVNEERKYMTECNGKPTGDGSVKFDTPTDCAMFRDKMAELDDMEVNLDIEPVIITESDLGDQPIAPADIANLEGFVTFE